MSYRCYRSAYITNELRCQPLISHGSLVFYTFCDSKTEICAFDSPKIATKSRTKFGNQWLLAVSWRHQLRQYVRLHSLPMKIMKICHL